jgi:hypothetical protein
MKAVSEDRAVIGPVTKDLFALPPAIVGLESGVIVEE